MDIWNCTAIGFACPTQQALLLANTTARLSRRILFRSSYLQKLMDLGAATVSVTIMRDFFFPNVSPRWKVNLSSPRVDRLAAVFFFLNRDETAGQLSRELRAQPTVVTRKWRMQSRCLPEIHIRAPSLLLMMTLLRNINAILRSWTFNIIIIVMNTIDPPKLVQPPPT